jgi:hypothetical protein
MVLLPPPLTKAHAAAEAAAAAAVEVAAEATEATAAEVEAAMAADIAEQISWVTASPLHRAFDRADL